MIQDIFRSLGSYFDSFRAIGKYGLWKYVFISILISTLLGAGIFWMSKGLGSELGEFLSGLWRWERGSDLVGKLASGLSYGLVTLVFLFIYKYVLFVALSPLMSYVSEHIESKYDGTEPIPFKFTKFFSDIVRGLRIALRNIVRELFFSLILLLLGLIPIFTLFSAVGIYLIQAYYAGFGNMDYYMERRLNVKESVAFVKRRKGAALANGAIFLLILMIPIAGMMIAPFMGAISATLFLLKESDI